MMLAPSGPHESGNQHLPGPDGDVCRLCLRSWPCPDAACPLHVYSESSARAKLARHRQRGENDWAMFACPWGDHWHAIQGTVDEFIGNNVDIQTET